MTKAAWAMARGGHHKGGRVIHAVARKMLPPLHKILAPSSKESYEKSLNVEATATCEQRRNVHPNEPCQRSKDTTKGLGGRGRGGETSARGVGGGMEEEEVMAVVEEELRWLERVRLLQCGKGAAQVKLVQQAEEWDLGSLSMLAWTCACVEASDPELFLVIEKLVLQRISAQDRDAHRLRDLSTLVWAHIASGRADMACILRSTPYSDLHSKVY